MVESLYKACKEASETFELIVDTREQLTERYEKRIEAFKNLGVTPIRQKLYAGDYSAIAKIGTHTIDYTTRVALERKKDLSELITCLSGTSRQRFEAELRRAYLCRCRLYIVVEEGSYADLVAGNFFNHVDPQKVLACYHTFEQRYGCHFVFVPPEVFPKFAHETLRRFIMDDLKPKVEAKKLII